MTKSTIQRPTLAIRLAEAEKSNLLMQQQVEAHSRQQSRLENTITDLRSVIENLKEQLFHKSLALATAEGQLQRVDHEDAERAEVVLINDMRTSKVWHEGGFEINGPAVPIQRAVLKYDLARNPLRTTLHAPSQFTEKLKHWVNRG